MDLEKILTKNISEWEFRWDEIINFGLSLSFGYLGYRYGIYSSDLKEYVDLSLQFVTENYYGVVPGYILYKLCPFSIHLNKKNEFQL